MLTQREFEVYMLAVTTAKPSAEIGYELGISAEGVRSHISRIFDVMGVSTRLELLVQYWYREMHPGEA